MPLILFILLTCVGAPLAQELSPAQIDSAKRELARNPALLDEARRRARENPELLQRIPQDRRGEAANLLRPDTATTRADSSQSSPTNQEGDPFPVPVLSPGKPFRDSIAQPLPPQPAEEDEIYGHQLFRTTYEPAHYTEIPDDYVIGPGDEILLRFWGRYNQERTYTIGKDGYVFIEPLNRQAYLPGMTYGSLKGMIARVSSSSPGVEGDVRIVKAHPINIHVTGNARRPGTVSAPAYYTFWQILMMSGGPSTSGSVRSVKVIRGGKEVGDIDIYEFLQKGRRPVVSLQDNDLIFFGRRAGIARVDSFVRIPGLFELRDNEALGDLVEHAGGLKSGNYSPRIQIERIVGLDEKSGGGPAWKIVDVDLSSAAWKKEKLHDGDLVTSKAITPLFSKFRNDVYITGAGVWVPGRYSAAAPIPLRDVLRQAGGLRPGARPNAELLRRNPNGLRSSYPIDLADSGSVQSLMLAPQDSLLTFHDSEFVEITTVKTRGYVRHAFSGPYAESLTLHGLLQRSGGTRDGALPYVYVKKTDDHGIVSYQRYPIDDSAYTRTVILDKRDEVLAFDYRDFNPKMPVTVLAFQREPLTLEFSEDFTLDVLIHELGGLDPLTDSSHIEISTPEFSDQEILATVSILQLDEKTASQRGLIHPGAVVFFRNDPRKEMQRYVNISGEIIRTGRYPLQTRRQPLTSIIAMAGGLSERANPYSITIERKGYDRPIPVMIRKTQPLKFTNDWILNDGDHIRIGRNDYNVLVTGAVFSPGIVPLRQGWNWKDYVWNGAGGPVDSAAVNKAYVVYPTGRSLKAQRGWGSAKIVSGARIVVPYKPPKPPKSPGEGFDYAKFIGATSASVTTLLSLFIIMTQLSK